MEHGQDEGMQGSVSLMRDVHDDARIVFFWGNGAALCFLELISFSLSLLLTTPSDPCACLLIRDGHRVKRSST